ncbi:MAG: 50S ribosomal protein L17 [Desulfobacteria bacterium]
MRHRKAGKKLNRTGSHRNAMFRNMVTSLFEHGRIQTTDAKAKELRRWADRMVTLAKRGDLHARRQALAVMRDKTVVHKLFEEAADRFGDRVGGYTNVVKIGRRRGDAAPVSLVELLAPKEEKEQKKKKTKATKKAAEKAKKKAPAKAKEKAKPKKVETEDKAAEKAASEKAKEAASKSEAEPQTKEEEENTEITEAPEPTPKEDADKG